MAGGEDGSQRAAGKRGHLEIAAWAILVTAAALATRVALLDSPPIYDELYHVLAGRSWARDGDLGLFDGVYERASLYTMLTGEVFRIFGDDGVGAARAPNVLLGVVFVTAAVLWMRSEAGRGAALLLAVFLVLSPVGIHLSQLARFYALHGVLFLAGALATYYAVAPDQTPRRRIWLAVGACCALGLAALFQKTTLVGAAALGTWVAIAGILPAVWAHRLRFAILAAAVALCVALVAIAAWTGVLPYLWARYQESPWQTDPFVYHRALRELYPTFWPLTPVAALVALRHQPRPALFCVLMAGIVIAVQSFAGVKNIRYIYYATPFLFGIWAMALAAVIGPVWRTTTRWLEETLAAVGVRRAGALATAGLALCVVFAALAQSAFQRSAQLAVGADVPPRHAALDWGTARAAVERRRESGDLIVTGSDLLHLAYLGPFDGVFSNNRLPDMGDKAIAVDPRTGRWLISEPETLARVAQCAPAGTIVADRAWWESPDRAMAIVGALSAIGASLGVERAGDVILLGWRLDPGGERPPFCDTAGQLRREAGRPEAAAAE